MRYCADTWFLLALYDKDVKAIGLFQGLQHTKDWLIISYIAYAETVKKFFQRGVPEKNIVTFFTLLESTEKIQLIPVDKSIGKEAAKVSLTYHLSLMDACIAATSKIMGCDILLSGDEDFNLAAKKKYVKVQSW